MTKACQITERIRQAHQAVVAEVQVDETAETTNFSRQPSIGVSRYVTQFRIDFIEREGLHNEQVA